MNLLESYPSRIPLIEYFVYFITSESIYLKSVHSGPKFKATISHDLWYVLGLYFYYYHMWKLYTYLEDRRNFESVGIISIKDPLDWVESQMDSNAICYFEFQTWNLALQPAYNIYNPQSKFYDVLVLDHTRLCTEKI